MTRDDLLIPGHYASIPMAVLMDARLTATDKNLYAALIFRMGDGEDPKIFTSAQYAMDTHSTEQTINAGFKRLVACGHLTSNGRSRHGTNLYLFVEIPVQSKGIIVPSKWKDDTSANRESIASSNGNYGSTGASCGETVTLKSITSSNDNHGFEHGEVCLEEMKSIAPSMGKHVLTTESSTDLATEFATEWTSRPEGPGGPFLSTPEGKKVEQLESTDSSPHAQSGRPEGREAQINTLTAQTIEPPEGWGVENPFQTAHEDGPEGVDEFYDSDSDQELKPEGGEDPCPTSIAQGMAPVGYPAYPFGVGVQDHTRLVLVDRRCPSEMPGPAKPQAEVSQSAQDHKTPKTPARAKAKAGKKDKSGMSPEVTAFVLKTPENMDAYLRFGAGAFGKTSEQIALMPSEGTDWLSHKPADLVYPFKKNWTIPQFMGFFWSGVSRWRAENEYPLTLPQWQRLAGDVRNLLKTTTPFDAFSHIWIVIYHFDLIRHLLGRIGQNMVLDETSLSHSLIKQQILVIRQRGQDWIAHQYELMNANLATTDDDDDE